MDKDCVSVTATAGTQVFAASARWASFVLDSFAHPSTAIPEERAGHDEDNTG